MRQVILSLALLLPFCFALNLRKLQSDEIETLFFTQCACENDNYVVENSALFPDPFAIEGVDQFSCPFLQAPFSDLSLEAKAVFELDLTEGESSLTSLVDNSFFRKEDGTRGNFFIEFQFDLPAGVVETETSVTLIDIPEENFFLKVTFDPTGSREQVIVSSHNRAVVAVDAFFNDEDTQISIVIGEQEGFGFERIPFAAAFVNSFIVGTRQSPFFDETDLPVVPREEVIGGSTEVKLFSNGGNSVSPLLIEPIAVRFGRNLAVEGDEGINNPQDIIAAARDFLSLGVQTVLPEMRLTREFVDFNGEPFVVDLKEFLDNDIPEITFAANAEGLAGTFTPDDAFAKNGVFSYLPTPEFDGEETFTVTIGRDEHSCSFDYNFTLNINFDPPPEEDNTGVVIGVAVVGIFVVGAAVGGFVFFKKK